MSLKWITSSHKRWHKNYDNEMLTIFRRLMSVERELFYVKSDKQFTNVMRYDKLNGALICACRHLSCALWQYVFYMSKQRKMRKHIERSHVWHRPIELVFAHVAASVCKWFCAYFKIISWIVIKIAIYCDQMIVVDGRRFLAKKSQDSTDEHIYFCRSSK